jgi:hypothetical protein
MFLDNVRTKIIKKHVWGRDGVSCARGVTFVYHSRNGSRRSAGAEQNSVVKTSAAVTFSPL